MGKIVYNGREYLSAGTASTMQGATSTTDGVSGLVPQPLIADREKFLKGDGTWGAANEVTANPQDTPTDELTSIDIDGTVYEIMGGSAEIGKGPFIDTSNIIASYNASTYTSGTEITATEDIFVSFYITPQYATGGYFYIDGVGVLQNWYEANSTRGYGYYVQKGQVFKVIYTPYDNNASRFGMTIYSLLDQGNGKDYYNPIIYSTEEREVGVWTDGKPLYQKTKLFSSVSQGEAWYEIDVNNTSKVIKIEVTGIRTEDGFQLCNNIVFPSWSAGNIGINFIDVTSTKIKLSIANGYYPLSDVYITCYYTKTTDTPGSGSYNTLGVPNVHYSTDEQVIGTWIDGKTLYQRTWELSSVLSVASNTWVDTSILKQGIDAIMYINGANAEGAVFSFLGARAQTSTTNYVQIQQTRNSAITLKYITIQYTKTTD